MAIIFPISPVTDQLFSAANKTWRWTGDEWVILPYNLTAVESASGNWNNTYNTVTSKEVNWDSAYSITALGNTVWTDTANTVAANSISWNNTYSIVNSGNSDWDSAYTTVAAFSASNWNNTNDTEALLIPIVDDNVDVEVGINIFTFRVPYAINLDYVRANVATAPLGGDIEINIEANGNTIFSTNLFIESGTRTSVAATTQNVLNINANLSDDEEVTVSVLSTGFSTKGSGLKLSFIGTKP